MTFGMPNQRVRSGGGVPIRREHLPTFVLESHDKCLADSSRGARDEGESHRPTVSPLRPSPMNCERRRMADVGHPAVSRESNGLGTLKRRQTIGVLGSAFIGET